MLVLPDDVPAALTPFSCQLMSLNVRTRSRTAWQRSFYEHVLRRDESTDVTAAYILANPVRAGLAAAPQEYPWLGSFVTTIEDLLLRAQSIGGDRSP